VKIRITAKELCEDGWINIINFNLDNDYEVWSKGNQRIFYNASKERMIFMYVMFKNLNNIPKKTCVGRNSCSLKKNSRKNF